MKEIGIVVKSIFQHAFDSEEWQSIFTTGKARDSAIAGLKVHIALLARAKQTLSNITSSRKRLETEKIFQPLGYGQIVSKSPSFTPED